MENKDIREQEIEIAKTARRCASNEASLLWALLGSALSLMIVLLNPAEYLIGGGLILALFKGFLVAGIAAYYWQKIVGKRIAQAKFDFNEIRRIKKETLNKIHLTTLRQRNIDAR